MSEITEYSQTEAGLAELRSRLKDAVYDVSSKAGMTEAKGARAELRSLRTGLEKKRVEIKAPALEHCRLIDAEAKRITAELVALEEPIDQQIKAEEQRIADEKRRAIEAEEKRIAGIRAAIDDYRGLPAKLFDRPTIIIQGQLARLQANLPTEDQYEEFLAEAKDAHTAAVARLGEMIAAARQREEEQARIDAERAELEKLRAEAEERRRKDEAEAAAGRAEEDRKAQAERDRLAAEQRAAEAAARAEREAEEKAERERQQAEIQRQREQARAEAEKLRQEREALAERERQIEAERRAEAARRRQQELAEVTIHQAATRALALLQRIAPNASETEELAAALSRELKVAA